MTWTEFVDLAKKAPELFEVYGFRCELLATGEVCHISSDGWPIRPEDAAKIQSNVLAGLQRFSEVGPYSFLVEINLREGCNYILTVLFEDEDIIESSVSYPHESLLESYVEMREAFING